MNRNYKHNNAIKHLYNELYELDKSYDFTYPRLKPDFEDYLGKLRKIVDDSLDIAEVKRITGHKFKKEDTKGEND